MPSPYAKSPNWPQFGTNQMYFISNKSFNDTIFMDNEKLRDEIKDSYFTRQGVKKEPKYTLIPIVRTPNVDPGDTFEVDLFVSGAGYPAENKLTTYHSHPNLVNQSNPGNLAVNIGWSNQGLVAGESAQSSEVHISERKLSPTGFIMELSNANFCEYKLLDNYSENNSPDWSYPPKLSEHSHDDLAPLQYRLNIDENADPGDYEISFIFTYGEESTGDDLQINQDRQDVSVHVNTRTEQLEPIPSIAVISGAVIALLSLLYTTGLLSIIWNIGTELIYQTFGVI